MKSLPKLIKENIVRFNANIKRFIGKRFVLTWLDEVFSSIIFGASPDDYFRYEFYRKSWHERNKFVTYLRSKRLIKKHNMPDAETVKMLNDKAATNVYFKDFIKREWIDLDNCTEDALLSFVEKHERVIIKPKGGSGGKGIFVISGAELKESAQKLKGCVAEQLIEQHPALSKLNSSSVNTLRVMTFKGKIISCVLKIGSGNAVVDNMCSAGMYGNVDLEYGITDSVFFDIDLNRYMYHPMSGAKLMGVEIPNWDSLGDFVHEAATKMPKVEYVGWDIAVLQDGFAVIEANEAPGHDLSCQSTLQDGIYSKIKEINRRAR